MSWLNRRREGAGTPPPTESHRQNGNGHYDGDHTSLQTYRPANAPPPPAPPRQAQQRPPQQQQYRQVTPAAAPVVRPVQFVFRKAVKYDAKLRMALSGPGGSGKTWTLLEIARALVGPDIAVLDTEHGSASKYADAFQFQVCDNIETYDPAIIPDLIHQVHHDGYGALIIDSWSHFWFGEGGELDQVDSISARSKSHNSFAAWRHVSPKHNRMIDAILKAPIHILVSMRVKSEWLVEKDDKGKATPRRIGLQPIMRDGVEYEFDVCGDMDLDNTLAITKSRCSALNGKVINKPGRDVAEVLRGWLATPVARVEMPAELPPAAPVAALPAPQSTSESERFRQWQAQQPAPPAAAPTDKPWNTFGEMRAMFNDLLDRVGQFDYEGELSRFGWNSVNDIRSTDLERALECYRNLAAIAQQREGGNQ